VLTLHDDEGACQREQIGLREAHLVTLREPFQLVDLDRTPEVPANV